MAAILPPIGLETVSLDEPLTKPAGVDSHRAGI